MAEFKIEISDSDVGRVLTSLASNYNRPIMVPNPDFDDSQPVSESNLEMIDNPESIPRFGNRVVREFLSENVKAYEIKLAKKQAADLVNTDITIEDPSI